MISGCRKLIWGAKEAKTSPEIEVGSLAAFVSEARALL